MRSRGGMRQFPGKPRLPSDYVYPPVPAFESNGRWGVLPMRTPAVVLASLLLACLLPAQAEDGSDIVLERAMLPQHGSARSQPPVEDPLRLHKRGPAVEHRVGLPSDRFSILPGVFEDRHPFWDSLFVSGGTYHGGRDVGLTANLRREIELGDMTFSSPEFDQLEGRTELQKKVPFVGGGFDASFRARGQWDLKVLAGAAFYGSGQVGPDPVMQSLSNEAAASRRNPESYEVLPLVQVGISYRF